MQRTIEKLTHDRRELEERIERHLDGLKAVSQALEGLEKRLSAAPQSVSKRRLLSAPPSPDSAAVKDTLAAAVVQARSLADLSAAAAADLAALADARDKEWDALGNNHLGMIVQSMEGRLNKLAASCEDVSGLIKTFLRLGDRLERISAALEENRPPAPADVRDVLDPIKDWRYARFENRHRGSREEILKKQERYLEFFKAGGSVLDLGCGRGEFLELLRDRGFRGEGVDLNAQMIAACRDNGLPAQRADILEALAGRPDASLDGIFSSQVIEHLSPAQLERLVDLSRAKLAPGGALVLETINPASVFALVQIYFLDLSHRLPIHPEALRFLLESAGFEDVRILFSADLDAEKLRPLPAADERSAILNDDIDRLNRLLFAAPEFAAAGRKG